MSGISKSPFYSFLVVRGNRKKYAKMLRSSLSETPESGYCRRIISGQRYSLFRVSRMYKKTAIVIPKRK